MLYLENCFHAVCNPPFQPIFPIRARHCWDFNPEHTHLSKAFAQGDSQQFQRGNQSIAPTSHAYSLLQKEQLTNSQHNCKILLLPVINPPHYPLLFSHQEKPLLLCKENLYELFHAAHGQVNKIVATREEVIFSFQPWPQKSALSLSHRPLVAVPPARALQRAAQRNNNKGNILFPQNRNHHDFSDLFTNVCPWQSKDQIREGMGQGEGRRDEQITLLREKHLNFSMPCCFGTCVFLCVSASDPAGPDRAGDCKLPLLCSAAEPSHTAAWHREASLESQQDTAPAKSSLPAAESNYSNTGQSAVSGPALHCL